MSNALFVPGKQFERGVRYHEIIQKGIKGRIACDAFACGVIGEIVGRTKGDHLEIGALFGGTAILAALMKRGGTVHVVDPLTGYYERGNDPVTGLYPSIEIFKENMERFGLHKKRVNVKLYAQVSDPLPVSGPFETALIDGDHSYKWCRKDWENVKDITEKYVIFDNVDKNYHGVVRVFSQASADPEWRPILLWGGVGVVERREQ